MDYTERPIRALNRYSGIVVDVSLEQVALADGSSSFREVVHHPGGVAVLPVDGDGRAWCVRQYRYPFGRHLLEIPAGKLERNEDPLAAARRELAEETGFSAGRWLSLGTLYTSPGFSTEILHLYLAADLRPGPAHPDPGELLDLLPLPWAELREKVFAGEIRDGKTVAAVLKAADILASAGIFC